MKIVVTGSTGFIGSNFINFLLKKKIKSKIYAFCNKNIPIDNIPKVKFVKYGLNKKLNLKIIDSKTIIIHLAWDYIPNYKTIRHKTIHLTHQKKFIKQILDQKPRSLFVMGTCFEYGFPIKKKVDENSKIIPLNHYAYAKNQLRIYIMRNINKRTKFTWARLFYVYGKNQPQYTLYGQFQKYRNKNKELKKLIKNKQLELDYLKIEDVCKYIYALSFNNKNNYEVNICSGKKISLYELINKWSKTKIIKIKKKKNNYFYGSNDKLKKIFNEFKKNDYQF